MDCIKGRTNTISLNNLHHNFCSKKGQLSTVRIAHACIMHTLRLHHAHVMRSCVAHVMRSCVVKFLFVSTVALALRC